MRKKRRLALIAAIALFAGMLMTGSGTAEESSEAPGIPAAGGEIMEEETGESTGSTEGYVYTGPEYDPDHLVIGNPTKLSGNFTTLMWGYNTADVDVTGLINGYNLILWDYAYEQYTEDKTVADQLAVVHILDHSEDSAADKAGDRTYIITLNDQMKYSDGTPITAADYAFSILLNTCPEAKALGGNTENYQAIRGTDDYRMGKTNRISGVRILNEHTLSLTIRGENRPFFYEMGLMRCYPMPIHIIAPGCEVADDGEGAYIQGTFTSELLQKTLLDPETGYMSHPSAVSGAYRLLSYDAESGIAEFEINDYYLGNFEGIRPSIRRITLMPADNETMIDKLASGEFGLLNKCLKAETITQGVQLRAGQNYDMTSYARIGQSFISFNCEKEIVGRQAVRQAIACCLDKDETVKRYAGDYGLRADGYYGLGQWMYRMLAGTLDLSEEEEAVPEEAAAIRALLEESSLEDLPRQELDIEKAARLLEEDGWTLNEAGEPFRPGTDDVRCREENGTLTALRLMLVYPEGNEMGEILQETFLPHLAEAGILVELEAMPWEQLLRQYYRQEERDCDMMYLGSNFNEVFDPEPTFDPADAAVGKTNYTGIADEALYERAKDLSMTHPGAVAEYERKWIAFQQQYGETLPAIPVYINIYVDFYTRWLKNYTIGEDITWSDAIVAAYMSDPEIPEEEIKIEEKR